VKPISIWYHTFVSGPTVDLDHGISIYQEQLQALEKCGLLDAANEFYIGVSGGEANACAVAMLAPPKAIVFENALDTCGELPTQLALQQWLPGHEDWAILYFHTKGAQYKGDAHYRAWRACMHNVVLWNWRACVKDLEEGFDCTGPHWVTPQQYPSLMDFPYFAGTMWWATAKYLMTLPKVDAYGPSRWEAESWVGKSNRKILVRPYATHWPGGNCMAFV
jgi:hypothetical protein